MAAIAIELLHPAHGARRVEFVTPKTLALLTDGRITTQRVGGRGGSPEALYLQWWPQLVQDLSFHVSAERRRISAPPARMAKLNGEQVTRGALKDGDVLTWREFQISVIAIHPLSRAEQAMVDAARSSDAALQVYADWLETRGAAQTAEWTRLAACPGDAQRARMNELARRIGGSFRALVARGPVERCAQSCGQNWEALSLVAEPCQRSCSKCEQRVTWCEDAESARNVRGAVTLDPATPRSPGDLIPRPLVVG